MSDILGDIILKNLVNLGLDETFNDHAQPMVPRLSRSSSYFASTPKPLSLSSEQLSDENWTFDIWSDAAPSKPQNPFRPDRSMSLTENSIPAFGKAKPLEVPPPPGFPPLSNQATVPSNRYKTELCRSFQENGSCKYGNKCQFAHGEAELRSLYRHPKYKTEACRTFYNFGYCPYGTRCHFIHEEKLTSAMNQKNQAHPSSNPRFLRQSVSFAGFLGSRSSSPPALHEPLGFTRAPSVSPPPADLLSPVFNDTFKFGQSRASVGDIQNIPLIIEPQKNSRCVCGHGNNIPSALNKTFSLDDHNSAYFSQPNLQRFSSEDSLSDRESYTSSSSNSGSTSPTFDSAGGKRLTVFARLSVSD
ncbi:hypothetical protein ACEWY4_007778 [Coilia grayii]|uniref:mRNA decay activator protein ZFP36 n=1 Tax=Coilia grayii TaxID=363190 RepID=A0ABD1K914_9TELE